MDAALDYLIAEEKEKSLSDPVYQKKLFIEFGLEEKK